MQRMLFARHPQARLAAGAAGRARELRSRCLARSRQRLTRLCDGIDDWCEGTGVSQQGRPQVTLPTRGQMSAALTCPVAAARDRLNLADSRSLALVPASSYLLKGGIARRTWTPPMPSSQFTTT